ncbi:MAG: PAS domain-containing protein [Bryobacteraceae bacterium]
MATIRAKRVKQKLDISNFCGPVIHTSPIPMAAVEGAGHIVHYVNPAFCHLVGKPEKELIGSRIPDAVTADEEFLTLLDRVYVTGQAGAYAGQEETGSPLFRSYVIWPALNADGGSLGTMIQVIEAKSTRERTVAINQALLLGAVHMHELTDAASTLNTKLLTEITQRDRVEAELHEADCVVRFDRDVRYTYVNPRVEKETGFQRKAMLGRTPQELGMPKEVVALLTHSVRSVFETRRTFATEFSYPSPGGVTHWEVNFLPEFGENGAVRSVLNVARDITEKKRLEKAAKTYAQEVQALAASLLTAQEEERRRVSGLLHDVICQQLAALAIDTGRLLAGSPTLEDTKRLLKGLQARVVKASEETRHLAYELYPSVLDDLGLMASLRSLCNEFSKSFKDIKLKFAGVPLPATVPREAAACLYRVARESLQNAAKHACAKHVSVSLALKDRAVVLSIADDGVGFEDEAAKGRGGLGFISMEERARLVGGTLSVAAQPGHGTRIALSIPMPDGIV